MNPVGRPFRLRSRCNRASSGETTEVRSAKVAQRRLVPALALALLALGSSAGAQTLGIDGNRFTVDGRPRFLLFVSYFDGLRRASYGGEVDTDFAYLKRIGFDGIRLLVNWQYPCGSGPADDASKLFVSDGTINEPMWKVFVRVLERAAAHGLSVDVTFNRDTYDTAIPVDAYRTAIAGVATRLLAAGGHRHVLFDVQNEYPIHGLTAADVHGILAAVKAADPVRIVTASGGGGDIFDDPAMDVVAYHDSREEDWHHPAAARTQLDEIRTRTAASPKPIYLQEPMPFRKFHPECGHGEAPRPGLARQAMRHARDHGAAAWTFHTRQSFDLRERPLVQIVEGDPEQKAELEAVGASVGPRQ
jgi:hypothetical protein